MPPAWSFPKGSSMQGEDGEEYTNDGNEWVLKEDAV